MVTSFISRWSKRKLDEKAHELLNTENQPVTDEEVLNTVDEQSHLDSNAVDEVDSNAAIATSEETVSSAPEKPEEMSIASLLASEAEQSVKKAALRKLFLSEEFNVRDGLDDYDEDYSNLKTLSQSVAETLREWVKEKPEEEVDPESTAVAGTNSDEQLEEQQPLQSTQDEDVASDVDQISGETSNEGVESAADDNLEGDETKYTTL